MVFSHFLTLIFDLTNPWFLIQFFYAGACGWAQWTQWRECKEICVWLLDKEIDRPATEMTICHNSHDWFKLAVLWHYNKEVWYPTIIILIVALSSS